MGALVSVASEVSLSEIEIRPMIRTASRESMPDRVVFRTWAGEQKAMKGYEFDSRNRGYSSDVDVMSLEDALNR